MLQLYRKPSIWAVLALCAYALNLLFHVIAFCSSEWATCSHLGRHTWFGLWQGCWHDDVTDEIRCSDTLFDHVSFNTDSAWLKGAQVLMTLSLILLLFMEFILIGYTCVERLKSYKPRMVGIVMGMSIAEASITGLILLMVGTEVARLENGSLSWGYWIKFCCLFLIFCTLVLMYKDRYHFFNSTSELVTETKNTVEKVQQNEFDNPAFTDRGSTEFSGSGSVNTSNFRLSSSGLGTFERDSSRSYSCSDVTVSTAVVSYAQEPSQRSSSVSRLSGSADDIARGSRVNYSQEPTQKRSSKGGVGGSLDNMAAVYCGTYSQEPTRRTSADSLTAVTGPVSMAQDPARSRRSAVPKHGGEGRTRTTRVSTSSIESDV